MSPHAGGKVLLSGQTQAMQREGWRLAERHHLSPVSRQLRQAGAVAICNANRDVVRDCRRWDIGVVLNQASVIDEGKYQAPSLQAQGPFLPLAQGAWDEYLDLQPSKS